MTVVVAEPRRDWMKVGARYSTKARRPQLVQVMNELEWHPVKGKMTLPFSPGEGIKAVIAELNLPKVSALAWNGALEFSGEYPSLYGIEANYKNGRARLFVVDNGTALLPVCADFWAAP